MKNGIGRKKGENHMGKFFFAALMAIGLSACQTTITLPGYTPTSSQSLEGEVREVSAQYNPPKGVKENQIRNTAIGTILLTEPVPSYVTNAFRLELRGAGIRLGRGNCKIALDVRDYAGEDLGWNITFISDINYELASTAPLWRKNVRISFTTDKFQDTTLILASLRDALAKNFDDVLRDPGFNAALTTHCGAGTS